LVEVFVVPKNNLSQFFDKIRSECVSALLFYLVFNFDVTPLYCDQARPVQILVEFKQLLFIELILILPFIFRAVVISFLILIYFFNL